MSSSLLPVQLWHCDFKISCTIFIFHYPQNLNWDLCNFTLIYWIWNPVTYWGLRSMCSNVGIYFYYVNDFERVKGWIIKKKIPQTLKHGSKTSKPKPHLLLIISGRLCVARDAFKVVPGTQRSLVWSRILALSLSKILNPEALSLALPNKHVVLCECVWMVEFTVCYSFFHTILIISSLIRVNPPLSGKTRWATPADDIIATAVSGDGVMTCV